MDWYDEQYINDMQQPGQDEEYMPEDLEMIQRYVTWSQRCI